MYTNSIVFVVETPYQGAKGGHIRSCLTVASAFEKWGYQVSILNIGVERTLLFENVKLKVRYINIDRGNALYRFKKLNEFSFVRNSIVYAFDYFSYNVVVANKISKVAFVLCGGPNIHVKTRVKNMVCFSKENLNHYKYLSKFSQTNFYHIPNRVSKNMLRSSKDSLRSEIKNDYPIVLKINRLSSEYYDSMFKAIQFSKELWDIGVKHNLVIIGYTKNKKDREYKKLKKECSTHKYVYLLEDSGYTENAADFIEQAKVVIAMGRGIMEAVLKQRVTSLFCDNNDRPVIISNEKRFQEALAYNFSIRTTLLDVKGEMILDEWKKVLLDQEKYNSVLKFQYGKKSLFDIDEARERYEESINVIRESNLFEHYSKGRLSLLIYFIKVFLGERLPILLWAQRELRKWRK